MRYILIGSVLTAIRLAILVIAIVGTLLLFQATSSKWALGLPIYLSPIFWWISYLRLKGDFDPSDWNNPFQSRKATLLFQIVLQTVFNVSLSGLLLTMTNPSINFRVILFPFVAMFVMIAFSILKLKRKREVLKGRFQLNTKAMHVWRSVALLGWLIAMIGMLAFDDNFGVFGLGFVIFAIATMVFIRLDRNPKQLK